MVRFLKLNFMATGGLGVRLKLNSDFPTLRIYGSIISKNQLKKYHALKFFSSLDSYNVVTLFRSLVCVSTVRDVEDAAVLLKGKNYISSKHCEQHSVRFPSLCPFLPLLFLFILHFFTS